VRTRWQPAGLGTRYAAAVVGFANRLNYARCSPLRSHVNFAGAVGRRLIDSSADHNFGAPMHGTLARLSRAVWAFAWGTCTLGFINMAYAADLVAAVSRTALSLPIYVAEDQGYFAAEGVSLRLTECIGGQRCVRRLLDGDVELATASDLPVMFNSFSRSDYAVIATFVTSSNDLKLIARRSAGISVAADLDGKRVGTVKGASAHYFLDAFLLFNNVDPKRIRVVDLAPESTAGALQRREVDALAIWEPNGWLAVQAIGADAIVLPSPRIYTESFNLVTTRRVLADREIELVKVLRALAKAQQFIALRPGEAQKILKHRLGLDDGFVNWAWKDLDYRLGLDQSLITTLEAEARWALREGHVTGGQRVPNYLRFIEPTPLRKAMPGDSPISTAGKFQFSNWCCWLPWAAALGLGQENFTSQSHAGPCPCRCTSPKPTATLPTRGSRFN
jgi:ABC-type nitrate/sulfonate/bicarbonate transport system substrate-binding protein